ncbi:hypothetical protein G9A89_012300 [Geosiphon pyriformis]|nr:hypothetical protein G9A89_012300 [Geosiphon pyriformis]
MLFPSLRETWETLADEEAKKQVPYPPDFYPGGQYIHLPNGETRYWLFGSETGKKVVFVHGMTIPSTVFKEIANAFAGKNFHVLVYDLYGRGYSASPSVNHDQALYVTQLALLLRNVEFHKTNVIGLSMGGAISVLFTQQFPEMVEKLALIAPAGLLDGEDIPKIGKFLTIPWISTIMLNRFTKHFIEKIMISRLEAEILESELADEVKNIVLYQFNHHRGFLSSYLSTLKHFPLCGLDQVYKNVGNQEREVLVIWGSSDTTVPYRHCKKLENCINHAHLITVDGGTHGLPITHPSFLTKELIKFFS